MAGQTRRPVERPKAERNAPRPGAVHNRKHRPDAWAPVRWGLLLCVAAWLARIITGALWGVGEPFPSSVGWMLATWGVAWSVAALIIRKHMTNRHERHAAGITLGVAGVWFHLVWWALAPAQQLMPALGLGVMLAVGAQMMNQREWERGRIRSDLDAWPQIMAGTVWTDVFPVGTVERIAPGVIRRRFRRKDHADTSVADLMDPKARTRYEERQGLEHGSVRVERDGKSSMDIVVTEVRKDPHAGARGVEWDGQALQHVWDELVVAYFEDGQPELFRPWKRGVGPKHGLIAGVTGSGKSTLMRLLAMAIAPAEEAVTHMIDCKSGQSFGKLAALFSWFTKDAWDACHQLEALVALMRSRQDYAREKGWQGSWFPSKEDPVHFVFIDELARIVGMQAPKEVLKRALPALVMLVQEGRSTGFCIIAATQFPTLEAIGSSQFRSQIDWRVCFRMSEAGHSDYILTKAPKGVDAANIDEDRNGTAYFQNGSKCRALPGRALNVPDGTNETGEPDQNVPDLVMPYVHRWWDRRTDIPQEETEVLDFDGAWSARTIYGPNGETYVRDPDDDQDADPPTGDEARPIPGVGACPDCDWHATVLDVVAGHCQCGRTYDAGERRTLSLLALSATAQVEPDPQTTSRPALALVPAPSDDAQEGPTVTTAAAAVRFSDLTAAYQPTAEEAAADAAALANQERAASDDDTPAARDAAWRLFVAAGDAGLTPVDVYRHPSVARSSSWGYKLLARWREEGYLEGMGEGRHRVAQQHRTG